MPDAEPAWERIGDDLSRAAVAWTIVRIIVSIVVLVVLYYLVPDDTKIGAPVLIRFLVGFAFFIFVLVWQIRQIINSTRPGMRAAESIATIAVLFLVIFALLYYSMERSNAANFSQHLDRTESLYFTLTVLSTVGYGDITPTTDPARIAVMFQMVLDIIFIGAGLRLFMTAAKLGRRRQSAAVVDQSANPSEGPISGGKPAD